MDVCLDRGLSFEPLVAELVGDDLIQVVDARGEMPLAGCRDRVHLLVPVEVGTDVSCPARPALGHGVGGCRQSENYGDEPCVLQLVLHVVAPFPVTEFETRPVHDGQLRLEIDALADARHAVLVHDEEHVDAGDGLCRSFGAFTWSLRPRPPVRVNASFT